MAIEEFGKSLLSNVREQNRKRARQERRRADRDVFTKILTGVAGDVAGRFLTNKANNFLQNESVLNSQVLFKNASAGREQLQAVQQQVDSEANGDYLQYFTNQIKPVFEENYKNQADLDEIGTQAYDAYISEQVKTLATERAEKFKLAYEASQNIKSTDQFNKLLASEVKNSNPSNIIDATTNYVTNLISGKSRKDRDQEAIKAIAKNDTNRERVLTLLKEFEATQNLVHSKDYSSLVHPKTDPAERFQEFTESNAQTVGDTMVIVETKVLRDRFGKLPDKPVATKAEPLFEGTQEDQDAKLLKTLTTGFNFSEKPQTLLTPEAFRNFTREVSEKVGTPVTTIKTLNQYAAVAEIFNDFVTTENNLKDPQQDKLINTIVGALVQHNVDVQAVLSGVSENPREDTKGLIINLSNISNAVKQIKSTNNDDQKFIENKHSNLISQTDWDSLTIEDKLKLNNKTEQEIRQQFGL